MAEAEAQEAIVPTISTFSVTKQGQVSETYALLQEWDLSLGLDENLERFRANNPIMAPTQRWLDQMRKIFRVRLGQVESHRPLIRLAQGGLDIKEWAPILLWHLCYRELLLSDFLEEWLFDRKQRGLWWLRSSDVREYLEELRPRGLLDRDWGESTVSRMASALPRYAADFGLLQGKVVKEIAPYWLPEPSLLYILHVMMEEHGSARAALDDTRWRRLLIDRASLEEELLRLHQQRRIHFEQAGSAISLELPCRSAGEYAESLVG